MSANAARRPRIGDVFRLPTARGPAYVQYTHETASDGSLVRVLPLPHESEDLATLVAGPHAFQAFVPIRQAAKAGLAMFAGNYPVPERAATFPLFKQHVFYTPGAPVHWSVWDGTRSTQANSSSPGLADLPIREIVTPDLLVERIERGWRPADEMIHQAPAAQAAHVGVRHFLYFATERAAEHAQLEIERRGIACERRQAHGDKGSWLLLVRAAGDSATTNLVERLSSELGAQYDGYDRDTAPAEGHALGR